MNKQEVMNHWRFFLSLEKDFVVMQNYIEVDPVNFKVFSLELSKLLQISCSEIDSVLRLLCSEIDTKCGFSAHEDRNGNISEYKKIIFRRFPEIENSEIFLPHLLTGSIKPWQGWTNKKPPKWWVSYNLIKHYRHSSFSEATLENVINSLSALMLAILYLYRVVVGTPYATPSPRTVYFLCHYFGSSITFRGEAELPSVLTHDKQIDGVSDVD
jgi:hypothetical protein